MITPLKVLVACEFSGTVRDAFNRLGHSAISCDLMESETPGPHYQGSVLDILDQGWDLMIAHPPCTYLASSGARWWKDRQQEQAEALEFVRILLGAPIPRIALENPIGRVGTVFGPASQIIQPWQHGHGETKSTCLWLKNLPRLEPSNVVPGREPKIHKMSETPDRWKKRSRTYPGIAAAMALQWGGQVGQA